MPELPEVEVIMQGITPLIHGQTITSVGGSGKRLRLPLLIPEISNRLEKCQVTALYRRAKYICFELSSGDTLVIHLGMTGNIGVFPQESPRRFHDHFWCMLQNGKEFRYNDTRRFGSISLLLGQGETLNQHPLFAHLGPEPLGANFTANYLQKKAAKRSIAIKSFLMDNSVVVGIGNIYANEILFHVGISPSRKCTMITGKEWQNIVSQSRKTLRHAIECGGSTISDYVNAQGESGYFQMNFAVYGKNGKFCSYCQTVIEQKKISGRASFFCPNCQK